MTSLFENKSLLHIACIKGNFEVVQFLILYSPNLDINQRDFDGATPLFYAVEYNNVSVAHFLLLNGADPNLCFKDGTPPLSKAVRHNYQEMTHLLLKYKAKPNVFDHEGRSPLFIAIFWDRPSLVRILLERGADVNFNIPFSLLHNAIDCVSLEMVEALIEYGADPLKKHFDPELNTEESAIDYCRQTLDPLSECRLFLEEYVKNLPTKEF